MCNSGEPKSFKFNHTRLFAHKTRSFFIPVKVKPQNLRGWLYLSSPSRLILLLTYKKNWKDSVMNWHLQHELGGATGNNIPAAQNTDTCQRQQKPPHRRHRKSKHENLNLSYANQTEPVSQDSIHFFLSWWGWADCQVRRWGKVINIEHFWLDLSFATCKGNNSDNLRKIFKYTVCKRHDQNNKPHCKIWSTVSYLHFE